MNIKEKLNKFDSDKFTVIEKRQFVRELIANNYIETISASATNSMNTGQLDNIIEACKNGTQPLPTNNTNDEVSKVLETLQGLLSKQSQTNDVDISKLQPQFDSINTTIETLADEVFTIKNALKQPTAKKAIARISATMNNNPIVEKLNAFYTVGSEANTNVLLLSPPSFGKSHAVRIIGSTYDKFIEHNCSDDIDEVSTLVGSVITDSSGTSKSGFIVVDGVLTQAVREASKGNNTLLFLDECLRWNESTQAFLLTFLNGFKKVVNGTTEKWYRLTTRSNNGTTLETIECPSKHLHIVGGANLTSDIPVEAFWSRFKKIRIDYSIDFAKRTTKAIVDSYDIKTTVINSDDFIEYFAMLVDETRQAVVDGSLQFAVDFRLLENAIHSSDGTFDGIVVKLVDNDCGLWNDVCIWNVDTGCVLEDSKNAITDILNKCSNQHINSQYNV
jgi:uncharacterized protein YqgV (UPF0045/DUF77 family)